MFERYTNAARQVIFHARYEASGRAAETIDPEHLLVGVLIAGQQEESWITSPVDALLSELQSRPAVRSGISSSQNMPLSEVSKKALAVAAEEASRLGDPSIRAVHLLSGLMQVDPTIKRLLHEHGIDFNLE